MRAFDCTSLKDRTWDSETLEYVARIHEHRGRQELYLRQKPVQLERLTGIAKVQSTEASNRIEGIVTTKSRLKRLVENKTTPRDRSEEEILGYRNVLNLVHENYEFIPLAPNYILQLHRDLLQFTTLSFGGQFKAVPNSIERIGADETRETLFEPLDPVATPEAVRQICESYRKAREAEVTDELLLIPCFVLDFLRIHPFTDGNGRMSRLLTLLLLYQSGYLVGKYVSIEKAIADTKENYYAALVASDQGWREGTNDPTPFIKYMLGVILKCYRDFESRITVAEDSGAKSTSVDIVRQYVMGKVGQFTKAEALAACPSLGSSSVEAALKKLVEDGTLKRLGAGRSTRYVRDGG